MKPEVTTGSSCPDRAPTEPGGPGAERRDSLRDLRVLVVDDDSQTVAMVLAILTKRGAAVESASSGPAALEMLGSWRPDLVLLDVMMPAMSGIEVLDRIREHPQHGGIPVILVTANSTDEDLLEGYKTGADYYITKPFTAPEILHGICLVLGRELTD